MSNWCEKHCFLSRSRRHDISLIVTAVPSASIYLYKSEIKMRVSTFNVTSEFSKNSRTALFFLLTRKGHKIQINTGLMDAAENWVESACLQGIWALANVFRSRSEIRYHDGHRFHCSRAIWKSLNRLNVQYSVGKIRNSHNPIKSWKTLY